MAALREAQDGASNGGGLSAERREGRVLIALTMARDYTLRLLRPEWLSFQSKPLSKNPDGLYLKSHPSSGCELISRKPNYSVVSNRRAADGIPQNESGRFTTTRQWRLISRNVS